MVFTRINSIDEVEWGFRLIKNLPMWSALLKKKNKEKKKEKKQDVKPISFLAKVLHFVKWEWN